MNRVRVNYCPPKSVVLALSGGQGAGGDQAAVKFEVVVDHAFGGEAFAGAGVGAVGIGVAHGAVGVELAKSVSQTAGVVGAEVEGGVAPNFAEAGNVVGDDGAAGESSFKRRDAERFVACGGGVDGGAAVERAQLGFGLRAAD